MERKVCPMLSNGSRGNVIECLGEQCAWYSVHNNACAMSEHPAAKQPDLKNLWAVEYSVAQKCFCYDTLDAVLKKNQCSVELGMQIQYAMIALFQDADACRAFIGVFDRE